MQIAGKELGKYPLVLAPMEDVTNPPFRKFCKEFGADWLYSEFVSADALVRSVHKSLKKLTIEESERPVTIQIYGRYIDSMTEAAKIVEEVRPDFIDLNFGCPVKRVAQKGAGAGLLKDIPLMIEMAERIVKAVKVPVTAKTRLGWDCEHIIIEDIAERLQDVGIQALAIHGRTRSQMYAGEADWEPIGRVKNNPRIQIPIIGNGDITSPQKAKEAFDKYGVDAVMIGRGAIGRPWIFKQIKHYFQTGEMLPDLSVAEQIDILKEQILLSVDWIDEIRGILHMRRHMAAMFKGLPHFRELRIQMLRAESIEELWRIFELIRERYSGVERA
ncbi:tRNA-dihydrouridine synthase [Odoribacter laneus]|jgi:putative TIM-barrel protein, nifR3 family|uniref:tRNA dihydrouridine synthase DusB n=1 Tax=Odoribacter laneus TaxID=626933 RepID=UPI00189ABC4E|nr:tRNA dihydrouridine synthase DusB [Odoribacter laneus]GKI23506.1 tRNA-dihydrouridine synthase [Odoribacter laneus]GKI25493.1 tRNA-dihydrouridine synthase [Odoribacter laneus]